MSSEVIQPFCPIDVMETKKKKINGSGSLGGFENWGKAKNKGNCTC